MNKKQFLFLFLVIILLGSGLLLYMRNNGSSKDENKISVLVSVLPQKEFVQAIGGDRVDVNELIHPGESPHSYNLTPQDLIKIERADIYFRIGYIPFEKANIETIAQQNENIRIIDTSQGVEIRYFVEGEEHSHDEDERDDNDKAEDEKYHENEIDPHIWLSPEAVKIQVENIFEALVGVEPESEDYFRENMNNYLTELRDLQAEISKALAGVETKELLVFHPAWGYFADEFGFEQVAIEQNGNEPTAEQLAHIIEEISQHNIPVIFVQKQFSTKSAKALAEETGISVVQIDPLAENYVENLIEIANTIKDNVYNE